MRTSDGTKGVRFSEHYEDYRRKLPDRERISLLMCEQAVAGSVERETQRSGRVAYWGYVKDEDRYLKVVLEPDGQEIVTTHFDRNFKKRMERRSRR